MLGSNSWLWGRFQTLWPWATRADTQTTIKMMYIYHQYISNINNKYCVLSRDRTHDSVVEFCHSTPELLVLTHKHQSKCCIYYIYIDIYIWTTFLFITMCQPQWLSASALWFYHRVMGSIPAPNIRDGNVIFLVYMLATVYNIRHYEYGLDNFYNTYLSRPFQKCCM